MEIDFYSGCSIDEAYNTLQLASKKRGGIKCWGTFNAVVFYSTDTLDECYLKATGLTREACLAKRKEQQDEYERAESAFKARIPELIDTYRAKARGVICEDKLELWDRIVPVRLNDLYHGMELDCCLTLVGLLNDSDGVHFDKAKEEFCNQGHSGMSGSLVLNMVECFHAYGARFKHEVREEML